MRKILFVNLHSPHTHELVRVAPPCLGQTCEPLGLASRMILGYMTKNCESTMQGKITEAKKVVNPKDNAHYKAVEEQDVDILIQMHYAYRPGPHLPPDF